jgi:hypothetical protein
MGMAMDMTVGMELITNVKISAAGRDTLRVHTTVDSVAMSMKSPMLEAAGMNAATPLPFKKGDTSVVLITTRGAMISQVAGSAGLAVMFSSGWGLPENLTPGTSWTVARPDLGTAGAAVDPAALGLIKDIMDQIGGSTKMTFEGEVDRGGEKAWKFVTSAEVADKSVPMPQMNATMTIKRLTASGESFVSVTGKFLFQELRQNAVQELSIEGNKVESTSAMTMRVERIR